MSEDEYVLSIYENLEEENEALKQEVERLKTILCEIQKVFVAMTNSGYALDNGEVCGYAVPSKLLDELEVLLVKVDMVNSHNY